MWLTFLRDWGSLVVSVLSLGISALAFVTSRKAVDIANKEHAWKAADRAREDQRDRWVREKLNTLKAMPDRPDAPRLLEVESDRHQWAQHAADLGLLRLFKRQDGKWFIRLPS